MKDNLSVLTTLRSIRFTITQAFSNLTAILLHYLDIITEQN